MEKKWLLTCLVAGFACHSGCQQMNTDLAQLNSAVSGISGQGGGSITNTWGVTNTQAMAWLGQNNMSWNDGGSIPSSINWYRFWAQQVHANTALAMQAKNYCQQPAWSTTNTGTNCQTYLQAYTDTTAQSQLMN